MSVWLRSAGEVYQGLPPAVHTGLVVLLYVVGIGLAVFVTARLIRWLLRKWAEEDPTAVTVATRITQAFLVFLGLELTLHHFGIRLTTLLAASGFVAVGLGFASKVLVENAFAGILLRLDRTIERGDIIIVKGRWLKVRRVGFRATTTDSYEEEEVLIPNTEMAQSIVSNLTRHGLLYRIRADVGVAYESDLELVRKTLEDCVEGLEFRSTRRESLVILEEFGDSSVEYSLRVWIDNADDALQHRSELREAIWRALKDAGITIAFPQLDVHLDPTGPHPGEPVVSDPG